MELQVFTPNELNAVLRALRQVAMANDRFTDSERALLEGVARIHGTTVNVAELQPILPAELAQIVIDTHRRKRAVQLAIVMALVEGEPSRETDAAVQALATAFGIEEEGLDVLYEMTHGRAFVARVDMVRRFSRFLRSMDEFPGVLKAARAFLGLGGGHEAVAARYRTLQDSRAGTFGRITPIAQGYQGLFDVPAVLEALHRGASCRIDLSDGFDIFERKDRRLDDVRRELGIPPLSAGKVTSPAELAQTLS